MQRRDFFIRSILASVSRFLAGGSAHLLLGQGSALGGTRKLPTPGEISVSFRWNKILAAHTYLRALASHRATPPDSFKQAVERYRGQMRQVRDPRLWFIMESYIAKARDTASLAGQLEVFPRRFRTLSLAGTAKDIAGAITAALPAYEEEIWPRTARRRREEIDPAISQVFQTHRKKLFNFLFTSLNAHPIPIWQVDIDLVGRYILTGASTRKIDARYFTLVETARFSVNGFLETVVMMLGRIVELEDRGHPKGALFLLRERQKSLNLPNPSLFPRAVLYWTAGEAIRRIVDPNHVHVGEALKIYQRGLRPFLPALREVWNPYL
ncbi:MAG: hypothetical protein ACE5ID_11445, partial [Acidobacteriota bacterium]